MSSVNTKAQEDDWSNHLRARQPDKEKKVELWVVVQGKEPYLKHWVHWNRIWDLCSCLMEIVEATFIVASHQWGWWETDPIYKHWQIKLRMNSGHALIIAWTWTIWFGIVHVNKNRTCIFRALHNHNLREVVKIWSYVLLNIKSIECLVLGRWPSPFFFQPATQ